MKAATVIAGIAIGAKEFQSTPPVKAATKGRRNIRDSAKISIHAAREGGDAWTTAFMLWTTQFQSTPPVKAATALIVDDEARIPISIHAAREGGDPCFRNCGGVRFHFNPRRP